MFLAGSWMLMALVRESFPQRSMPRATQVVVWYVTSIRKIAMEVEFNRSFASAESAVSAHSNAQERRWQKGTKV